MPETVAECPLSDRDVSLAEVQPTPAHTFIYPAAAQTRSARGAKRSTLTTSGCGTCSPRTDAGEQVVVVPDRKSKNYAAVLLIGVKTGCLFGRFIMAFYAVVQDDILTVSYFQYMSE